MSAQPILVAFATTEGQSEKIAKYAADLLRRKKFDVRLWNLSETPLSAADHRFCAAFILGSLHAGQHQPELARFLLTHKDDLRGMPSAFVSVSLSAGSTEEDDIANARAAAQEFLGEAGWRPDMLHLAGGAVRDKRLGFFRRIVIHAIMRMKGVVLDPSGETEFTDWPAFARFVEAFVARLTARTSAG